MSPYAMIGAVIVQLAILSYTIGIVMEQRSHRVSARALKFLVAGVIFDILATGCMIAGSSSGVFTLHGILGFSLPGRHAARNDVRLAPPWQFW